MLSRLMLVTAMVSALSGCTAGIRPLLEDYQGADAARIRIGTGGATALRVYQEQGGCYKRVLDRRLSAGFAVLGLPVTGSKSVGMPASSELKGMWTNEFKIKPGQLVSIVRFWHRSSGYETYSTSDFIPEANKDYEIIVKGTPYLGDRVYIQNLADKPKVINWPENVKMCPRGRFELG
ncbi:hypothetical protein [Siccibacter turicensis]|uniref:hypothetical protein n=1 Tax=Siccibacter turicensis TaxID=357233 RepID=UPI003F56C6E8